MGKPSHQHGSRAWALDSRVCVYVWVVCVCGGVCGVWGFVHFEGREWKPFLRNAHQCAGSGLPHQLHPDWLRARAQCEGGFAS